MERNRASNAALLSQLGVRVLSCRPNTYAPVRKLAKRRDLKSRVFRFESGWGYQKALTATYLLVNVGSTPTEAAKIGFAFKRALFFHCPLAQLARALGSDPGGSRFESWRGSQ